MKTTDIWFASFLQLRGYPVTDFEVVGRGRGCFDFEIGVEEWKAMRLEFNYSDISKVKQIQLSLKDLLF